eukprot:m.269649 g.269649  ORF g.269649 m.269649 type:complete len:161 (-) comp79922_c0_seq1:149-631(-)
MPVLTYNLELFQFYIHGQQPTEASTLSMEEVRKVLTSARSMDVHVSQEAADLIQSFFIATRRTRRTQRIPQSILVTMLCLAKCHAALCLRNEAVLEDATVAIWLQEESLMTSFEGVSILGLTTSDTILCGLNAFSGDTIEAKLSALQDRIVRFCANIVHE